MEYNSILCVYMRTLEGRERKKKGRESKGRKTTGIGAKKD